MKIKSLIVLFIFFANNFNAQEKNYIEQEVNIPTSSVIINGTLLNSTSKGKKPLVIIIPGSGPTDRNGNNIAMKNNSLKYLALGIENQACKYWLKIILLHIDLIKACYHILKMINQKLILLLLTHLLMKPKR